MKIQHFFDPDTFTFTNIVSDPSTKETAITDPVLDFIKTYGLKVKAIIETHADTDHLSSSHDLKLTKGN
jgi:glyoxylase-like metal-dependent hydrolase (beta-lactamase superfamily II)